MFTVEQHIVPNFKNQTKNKVLENGMRLAKAKSVKLRFTYREFTLIVGVLVALIVVFTFWYKQNPQAASDFRSFKDSVLKASIAVPLVERVVRNVSIERLF
jgi:hypothetical protein